MPETNEQNTNSALEERLSTFKKINSSMIAVNDTAYDTYGFGSRRYRRIEKDRERILEVINEGEDAPELLKDFNVQEVVLALPGTVEGEEGRKSGTSQQRIYIRIV